MLAGLYYLMYKCNRKFQSSLGMIYILDRASQKITIEISDWKIVTKSWITQECSLLKFNAVLLKFEVLESPQTSDDF